MVVRLFWRQQRLWLISDSAVQSRDAGETQALELVVQTNGPDLQNRVSIYGLLLLFLRDRKTVLLYTPGEVPSFIV